jgi:hypothetical protein
MTITKNFTATGSSDSLPMQIGQTLTYSLSGTFVGTIAFERSDNGGASWENVFNKTTTASATDYLVEVKAWYRWRCTAYTSGVATATLAEKTAATVTIATGVADLTGAGAPVDAVQAAKTVASAGNDNNLTFTAVAYGTTPNSYRVGTVQQTGNDKALAILISGNDFTVKLPTDSNGDPDAATAEEVKTEWDASSAVDYMTVAFEGDGSGTVSAVALAALTGGVDGTGAGVANTGSRYTDTTAGELYINTGTADAPAWVLVGTQS